MGASKILIAATLMLAAIAGSVPAAGQPLPQKSKLEASGAVRQAKRPPLAYQLFCLKNPRDCKASGKSQVTASQRTLGLLRNVNAQVNRAITPRNDARADVWSVDVKAGDCEDYALQKRRELIKAGLPASALRMALVKTPLGEGHAVLVVKTDRGDLVLDNRRSSILERGATGYRWIKVASANPNIWR